MKAFFWWHAWLGHDNAPNRATFFVQKKGFRSAPPFRQRPTDRPSTRVTTLKSKLRFLYNKWFCAAPPFRQQPIHRPSTRVTTQPVPGNNILAANLMAKAWNSATELQTVTMIGAAKSVARKWTPNLPVFWHYLTWPSPMGRKKKETLVTI